MGLHKGMKYKKNKKICKILAVEGNEIKVKCGRNGKSRYINKSLLDKVKFIRKK